MLQSLRSWRGITVAFTGAAFLFACAADPAVSTKKKRTPMEPGDEFYDDDIPSVEEGLAPTSSEDSGAFGAPERPATAGPSKQDAGNVLVDGGSDGGVVVPPPKVFCVGPLAAGDLQVSEMLISSRAGSNDDGEWVEVRSTRTCWLKLQGLAIESPRGAAVNGVTVADGYELEPKGSFVVADSADPVKNHGLPGKVYAWATTDVLKNDGDTLSLKLGPTVVDTVTYPSFSNITAGRAIAFPSDCPAAVRSDWQRWSLTFNQYQVGFKGTPNGANDDVACY